MKVAERNKTFKTADVKWLLDEAIGSVTVEDWNKCVQHAEKLHEVDYCNSDRDKIVQHMLINVGGESSSEDEYGFQTEDEDEDSS